jgi:hypothetical protein
MQSAIQGIYSGVASALGQGTSLNMGALPLGYGREEGGDERASIDDGQQQDRHDEQGGSDSEAKESGVREGGYEETK